MLIPELLTEARHVALTCAPELAAAPLYFIENPPGLPIAPCAAYATRSVDFAIRDELIRRGDWQGRGAMVVFNEADAGRDRLLALTLHEIGHLLPHRTPREDREPTPEQREWQAASLTRWATAPDPPNGPPWAEDHDARFVRRVLHLRYRAAVLCGVLLAPCELQIAGDQYDMSPAHFYDADLGDEPRRMLRETFATITATPSPAAFAHRWHGDQFTWTEIQRLRQRAAERRTATP